MVRQSSSSRQAVQVPQGLPQGKRQQLEAAQRAIPLPKSNTPPSPSPGAPGSDPALAAASQMAPEPGLLSAPTNRPNEPITAGMATGPGAGPQPMLLPNMPDPDLARMAPYLPMLEALADDPHTAPSTRNWIRNIRGSMPPNATMANVAAAAYGKPQQ